MDRLKYISHERKFSFSRNSLEINFECLKSGGRKLFLRISSDDFDKINKNLSRLPSISIFAGKKYFLSIKKVHGKIVNYDGFVGNKFEFDISSENVLKGSLVLN